jgi:hypothetical protein
MEFQSHIVMTSQSMNKNLGLLTPPLALFTNNSMPNLIKTTLGGTTKKESTIL